jgi:hypothetical protein
MKKISLLSILLAFALFATACGSAGTTTGNSSANATDSMTPALQLALGTLNLEGTDQAIDAEMAAQLLPLWQLLNELNANGSTATQEVTAVIGQIKATMTSGQVRAIDNMQISQKDISAAVQNGGATSTSVLTSTTSAQNSAGGGVPPSSDAGGMPSGGMPPDAGGAAGGPGMSGSVLSAQNSQSSGNTSSNSLIEQVIKLLESKM